MRLRRLGKWLLWVVVLLGLLVGALFIPSVQKAILVAVLSGPEREIRVESFRIGLGGASATGLEFREGETLVRVPSFEAEFRLLSLVGKRPEIARVSVEDFFVLLPEEKNLEPEPDEERGVRLPGDFSGILSGSVPFTLRELTLGGSVSIRQVGEVQLDARVLNVAPGETGGIQLSLVPGETANPSVPRIDGTLAVPFDAEGRPEKVSLDARVYSRVPGTFGELQLVGEVVREELGERYMLDLISEDLFAGGRMNVDGDWESASRELSFRLSASGQNLGFIQPFVEQPLPEVRFQAEASLTVSPGEAVRGADLSVSATVPRKEIPDMDRDMGISADFELLATAEAGVVFSNAFFHMGPVDDPSPWLSLQLTQPLALEALAERDVPEGEFGSLQVALPGAILSAFMEGWALGDLTGGWKLVGAGDLLRLQADESWSVSVGAAGSEVVTEVSFVPDLSLNPQGELEVEIDGSVAGGDASLVFGIKSILAREDPRRMKVGLTLDGELQSVMPLLPGESVFPEGLVNAELDIDVDEWIGLAGRVDLSGLKVDGLPEAQAELILSGLKIRLSEDPRVEGAFSGIWSANGGVTSVEATEFSLLIQPGGRPLIESGAVGFDIDPRSFAGVRAPDSESVPKSASGGLPPPERFSVLKESIVLPVDLAKIRLDGGVLLDGKVWQTRLEMEDIVAGSADGRLQLTLEPVEESSGMIQIEGRTRIDNGGTLRSLEGSARLPKGVLLPDLPGLFVELEFIPGFEDGPLSVTAFSGAGGVRLLNAAVSFQEAPTIVLESDLSTLRRTEWGAYLPNLDGGRLRLSSAIENQSIGFDLKLAAVAPLDSFDSFDLDGEGVISSLEPIQSILSVRLTDARDKSSDLRMTFRQTEAGAYSLGARGDRLDVEAVQDFAAIWRDQSGTESHEGEEPDPEAGADPWPFDEGMPGFSGTASFASIVLPESATLSAVEATWRTAASDVSLRTSGTWMEDSSFTGEVRLHRTDSGVEGSVQGRVEEVEMQTLLRQLQPGESPSVEGIFSVGLDFSGRSETLQALPGEMEGLLSVEGRDGLIRSLKPERRVTRLVEVGSLAGILLSDTLNRPGVAALGEVVMLFKEVPFHSLGIELARTGEQRTEIRRLQMRGPYLSLDGAGMIEPSDLEGIPESPMQIKLLFGAKDRLAQPLLTLGLLGTEPIATDYTEWKKPVLLKGTLLNPDPGELWDSVINAVERAATMNPKDLERESRKQQGEKKKDAKEQVIEEGVNQLFNILGL